MKVVKKHVTDIKNIVSKCENKIKFAKYMEETKEETKM
jgi:hypothetical protein